MIYKKLVPEGTFLHRYISLFDGIETASSYDFWCAMWLLSIGLGRESYVDRPMAPVRFNLYIILVALSGITRKTTAIVQANKFIDHVIKLVSPETQRRLKYSTDKITPTNLELLLHNKTAKNEAAQFNFISTEMVRILGREPFLATLPGLLTDLFDCPDSKAYDNSRAKGSIEIKNVYINMLTASTPTWLITSMNPTVIEGGFSSRVFFIREEERKKSIAWPIKYTKEAFDECVEQFITTLVGARESLAIDMNVSGLAAFTRWYNKRRISSDPFVSSFESREQDYVLKVAGLLCINDGILEIQKDHINTAIKLVAEIKERSTVLLGNEQVSLAARLSDGIDILRRRLIEAGQDAINHTELYLKVRAKLDNTEYKLLIKLMHEGGFIQVFKLDTGKKMYRATQNMNSIGMTEKLLTLLNKMD